MSRQTLSVPSLSQQLLVKDPADKSLKTAFGRLCRKLSPKKSEKRRIPVVEEVEVASGSSEFKRVFQYFDEDGDGKISPAELRSCMKTVGEDLTVEDAEAVVESSDSDGDGLLGFEDFVKLVEVEGEEEKRKHLRDAFGMYEMDGSGCITPKSLKRMLSRLGEKRTVDDCKTMINRFDLNGDGVLNFEEFAVMMI